MMGSVKAVETKINDDIRYVLIDIETGEIIDDAQGYGFRTPQKAYSAYSYRLKQNGRKTYTKKDVNYHTPKGVWLSLNYSLPD